MVLDVVDACQLLVARGVAATTVEDLDFGPVLRAREELGPSDAEGVDSRRVEFLGRLEQLP
jgi:V/A-type H+/Na+-transporting ATPase subunit A